MGSILWKRLDVPGHDACRLEQVDTGWSLEGTAVFSENGIPARLDYRILADSAWCTKRGEVHGWLGGQGVDFRVTRTSDGVWTLNGAVVPGLEVNVDLDLGFTPATNLLQLRRVNMEEGEHKDLPVAWLDAASATLTTLQQRYERRSVRSYWYESPTFGYRELLEVHPGGFVLQYPGLWSAESIAALL